MLPAALEAPLRQQLAHAHALWVADRAEGLAGVPLADTLLMVTTPSTTPPSATRFPTAPMRATRLQARENLPCCHLNFPVMPSSSVVATSAF